MTCHLKGVQMTRHPERGVDDTSSGRGVDDILPKSDAHKI